MLQEQIEFSVIILTSGIADVSNALTRQSKNQRHYKAIASYVSKIISDPMNYRWMRNGTPAWDIEALSVVDGGLEIIHFSPHTGRVDIRTNELNLPKPVYGAVLYIAAAMRNAVKDIIEYGQEWLTPTEIENQFNLKSGTVTARIRNNQEKYLEYGYVRRADKRTWLIKRGFAIGKWGTLYVAGVDHAQYRDENLSPKTMKKIENLEFSENKAYANSLVADSPAIVLDGFSGKIQKRQHGDIITYKVITWKHKSGYSDDDAIIQEDGSIIWNRFDTGVMAAKYSIIEALCGQ